MINAGVRDGVCEVTWGDPCELDVPALHAKTRELRRGISVLQIAEAGHVAEIVRRGSFRADGARDVKAWLRHDPLVSSRDARVAAQAAEVLRLLPEIAEVVSAGGVSVENVALLSPVTASTIYRDQFRLDPDALLAAAGRERPEEFIHTVERFLMGCDADGGLARRERVRGRRRVEFSTAADGSSTMLASGPAEDLDWVAAAIELHANRHWCLEHPERNQTRTETPPLAQRWFDSLVDICRGYVKQDGHHATNEDNAAPAEGRSASAHAASRFDRASNDIDGDIASGAADSSDDAGSSPVVAWPAAPVPAPVAAPSAAVSLPSPALVSPLLVSGSGGAGWANRRLAPSILGIVDYRQWPPLCSVNGRPAPLETLERLACESSLYRLVLDANSVPLDLGETARFASRAQYNALLALDKNCSAPRCRTPGKWSVVHHIVAFPKGPTAWKNMVLLCDRHHHLVHEGGWQVQRDPSNPARIIWIDPTGQPRPPPPG